MINLVEGIAASNKALKGLALKVTFQEGETVQTEFYRVRDALLDWQRAHGAGCGALGIEYQAGESSWPHIHAANTAMNSFLHTKRQPRGVAHDYAGRYDRVCLDCRHKFTP